MRVRAYVMARKGVLSSDPSVQAMSDVQWLFDYHALARREHEELEYRGKLIEAVRKFVVEALGLNLGGDDQLVPLALLTGTPEILQQVMGAAGKDERLMEEEEYESFVQEIMEGGDMVPMLEQDIHVAPDPAEVDALARLVRPLTTPEEAYELDG